MGVQNHRNRHSNGKVDKKTEEHIKKGCEIIKIDFHQLSENINPLGVVEDKSILLHLSDICKDYWRAGESIAHAATGLTFPKETSNGLRISESELIIKLKNRAITQVKKVFNDEITEKLSNVFDQHSEPKKILRKLQEWQLLALSSIETNDESDSSGFSI
jgi:hypothetical protein